MTPSCAPRSRRDLRGACLLALLLCGSAQALESDRAQPLDVTADNLKGGLNEAVSVLTGHVRMTQGSIEGTGDQADIHQKDQAVTRVVLTGTPATFQQGIEGGGAMKGRARNIDYDANAKRAVLTGDAVVEHPRGEARGARLTYETDSGRITGDGTGGDGRVHLRMVPQPKKADDKAKDADQAKPSGTPRA